LQRNSPVKEEFVKLLTTDIQKAPMYFSVVAKINKSNRKTLDEVLSSSLNKLSLEDVKKTQPDLKSFILDTRDFNEIYETGYIPNSICIPLSVPFCTFVG